ncbi:MAG: hypothetical protein KIT60_19880 [Burkholderiaceae bacterium]|nr:hypothetical protein [Burkholderiaceae bacterium]
MNARLLFVVVAGAVAPVALANSGFTPGSGESSGSYHWMPSTVTVEQVRAELATWKRNPVTADGLRQINGDPGWVYVGTGASSMTRAAVRQELAEFRRNPVASDGAVWVGGDVGWASTSDPSSRGVTAGSDRQSTAPVALRPSP